MCSVCCGAGPLLYLVSVADMQVQSLYQCVYSGVYMWCICGNAYNLDLLNQNCTESNCIHGYALISRLELLFLYTCNKNG